MMKSKRLITIVIATLFLIFLALFVFLVLLKDLDKKVELAQKLALQKQMYEYSLENRKHLENELRQYHYIEKFIIKVVDEKGFREFLTRYTSIKKIVEVALTKEQDIVKKRYKVKGVITAPKDFYDLIDSIEKEGYPVMVEFPISFSKVEKMIEIEFFVTLFELKR